MSAVVTAVGVVLSLTEHWSGTCSMISSMRRTSGDSDLLRHEPKVSGFARGEEVVVLLLESTRVSHLSRMVLSLWVFSSTALMVLDVSGNDSLAKLEIMVSNGGSNARSSISGENDLLLRHEPNTRGSANKSFCFFSGVDFGDGCGPLFSETSTVSV